MSKQNRNKLIDTKLSDNYQMKGGVREMDSKVKGIKK